jgi:hypothetical protein
MGNPGCCRRGVFSTSAKLPSQSCLEVHDAGFHSWFLARSERDAASRFVAIVMRTIPPTSFRYGR